MTVRMRLDARGMVRSSEAFSSAIHSSARLSYDEVEGLLEGNGLATTAANHSIPVQAVEEFACEFDLTEENIRKHSLQTA